MPEIGCTHDDSWTGNVDGHWVCDVCGADRGPQEYDMILSRMKRAEADLESLAVTNGSLVRVAARTVAERDEARAALARIEALHPRMSFVIASTGSFCERCDEPWPCPTIAALRGDEG